MKDAYLCLEHNDLAAAVLGTDRTDSDLIAGKGGPDSNVGQCRSERRRLAIHVSGLTIPFL